MRQRKIHKEVTYGRIYRAPTLHVVAPGKVVEVLDHGRQVGVVYPLLQVSQHSLVIPDVVDDGDDETHGVLVWRQLDIGSRELEEDEDLLLVAHEAGLAHWEHIGGEGWDGEAEGDCPLELVLSHKLRLQLIPHQLNNILQNLSWAV